MSHPASAYLRDLSRRIFSTFWEIARIMLPIMVLIRAADTFGLIEAMSPALRPVMALVNLPPEAAIVCITSILVGIYGAIAALPVLAGYDLTAAQVTSICAILLIAHALPIEQAIVRRAGGSFWGTSFLRLIGALFAALLIDLSSRWTGYLSEPQGFVNIEQFLQEDQSHLEWLISSAKGMAMVFLILAVLLVMMDAFDRFGITKIVNRLFSPIIRLSGLERSVTSITTAGLLLGLAFGGGLIIARGSDPSISPKAKYYALCWLSICHGIIEDFSLMVLIGGDFWVLFAGRFALTLVMIRALMLWHDFRGKDFGAGAAGKA